MCLLPLVSSLQSSGAKPCQREWQKLNKRTRTRTTLVTTRWLSACLLAMGAGANSDIQETVKANEFNIGVHTLNVINLSWAINPTWQLTCTFHLDILWCPKLCFRFLYMQDTACKTRREVVPTPGKKFYTLHEISAQEYYCARGSAGQYCRYPGISWYPVSIVMPICTVSSIKTMVVYYFWGIKGHKGHDTE